MSINWTAVDVIRIAPELGAVPIAVIDSYSAMADLQLNETTWGNRYRTAGIFLTAHLLTIAPPEDTAGTTGGSSAGPMTQATVGNVSSSFASLSSFTSAHELALSRYGVEFSRLTKLGIYGASVI